MGAVQVQGPNDQTNQKNGWGRNLVVADGAGRAEPSAGGGERSGSAVGAGGGGGANRVEVLAHRASDTGRLHRRRLAGRREGKVLKRVKRRGRKWLRMLEPKVEGCEQDAQPQGWGASRQAALCLTSNIETSKG
jgi:hypothetical protein